MDLAQTLGWLTTALFTICFIPQIMKTWKTQTVDGLSFLFLFISFVANIVAFVYATLIEQPPLQIKYILAMLFLGPCLVLYVHVWGKKKKESMKDED